MNELAEHYRMQLNAAECAIFDVDGTNIMRGQKGVRDMVNGPSHQSLLPNCAHTIGPAVVEVDGDRAVATGYSRIYLRTGDNINLFRIGCNRWELVSAERASAGPIRVAGKRADDLFELWCYRLLRLQAA